ncbi:MAG: hypothetical protein LKJ88_05245 [Bacilli bacterium]|jgi:hypothetical protein|nr:hypothetical protein [Bacilli bacterium]
MLVNLITILDWQPFNEMNPWQVFAIGLGTATVLLVAAYLIIFFHYRSARLKVHKLTITLDGGEFQGSTQDLVFKAKLGSDIDISHIAPTKEGYRFNGFNVYKRFVSSTIDENGISKSMVTSEEMDGMGKDVIMMPDYDLYLVAKYSPLPSLPAQDLSNAEYYPDFLCFEDLVAELKHLNYNQKDYPIQLNFRTTERFPGMLFIFKSGTICAMLMAYKCLTKVFLRTPDDLDGKLLTPFYQEEDINDAMNWYSFIVSYTTKPSRFLRSFKESYDAIDSTIPTSEIEFDLIVGSLSAALADPVLDRALALTQQYEKDRGLPIPPSYVEKRELPGEYGSQSEVTDNLGEDAGPSIKAGVGIEEPEEEEKPETVEEKKPEEVQPVEEIKKEEQPEAEKPEEVKPEEVKQEEVKPEEVKPEEVKPEEESKPVEPTPAPVEEVKEEEIEVTSPFDLEEEYRKGHYIQPRHDHKFIVWDEATKEEKILSVEKYYKYHPAERPSSYDSFVEANPLEDKSAPTQETENNEPVTETQTEEKPEEEKPVVEEEKPVVEETQPSEEKPEEVVPEETKKTETEEVKPEEQMVEETQPVVEPNEETTSDQAEDNKVKNEEPVSEDNVPSETQEAPRTLVQGYDLEQEFTLKHFAQPLHEHKFVSWKNATDDEKVEAIKKYYAAHPSSDHEEVETKVAPAEVKKPEDAPLDELEKAYQAGHYIQPKRDHKFLSWKKATREEKIAAVEAYKSFHQN